MTATDSEGLSLRRERRWAYEILVAGGLVPPLLVLVGALIVHDGPFDYRWIPGLATITAWIWGLLVLPAFVYRMTLGRRGEVTATAEGIRNPGSPKGPIAWSDIVGLRVVRRPAGYRVQVVKEWGEPTLLHAPLTGWLPGQRFQRDVAELRELAVRHGVELDGNQPPPSRWPVRAFGMALTAVLLATGGYVVAVGAVWPWTTVAARIPLACNAADAAGLEQHWPSRLRLLTERSYGDQWGYAGTRCVWDAQTFGSDEWPPFATLGVTIWRFGADEETSAVAAAAVALDGYLDDTSELRNLDGIGDEAYMDSRDRLVMVWARKANVVVFVRLDYVLTTAARAEPAAQGLIEGIIRQIRRDTREG